MSNHLIWLEKHMFVAALFDRVLVFPSPKFDYDYGQVLDLKHINECFGRKVVVSFSEFPEMKKNRLRIDRFVCYVSSQPCYLDEDHIKKLKEDGKLVTEKKRVAGDIMEKFASIDEVLAIGEMFKANLEEEWVMQPGGPLASKCNTVIQPSRLIVLTAQRFVQTFLGSNFVALHFRRHGFLKFCPLFNSTVVLQQLTSLRAQRRGRRALEVLRKLARRRIMYHFYAMQVHGYMHPSNEENHGSFILVHGYHGSYSLRHWLQLTDWLPTLEATLALDEEQVRRVGDDTIGGPAVTRQLRLIRIVMRDLLIGVNYLHSHGLAHTELRLETIHISPVDKHVKVGILGNAADFYDNSLISTVDGNVDRRKLMIAFDMRCVGFIMAKMVLRELMDASTFMKFKTFLTKGNNPSSLREFLLPILCRDSPSGNPGLQMLDRNWGAGWNLLSLLLAIKPSERISCLEALRHPFLCGPRWRVDPSMDVIRWGLGSTAVRMAEDYIYGRHQRNRIAYFIELMELLNPHPRLKNWLHLLPGKWRLLYCTGRHIGLTLRQASHRVLIGDVHLTFARISGHGRPTYSLVSDIGFNVMPVARWLHDKSGDPGKLRIESTVKIASGQRLYLREENTEVGSRESVARRLFIRKWKTSSGGVRELPSSIPAAKILCGEIDVAISFDSSQSSVDEAGNVLQEVRTQIPPEMFDISKLVCGTYVDSRLMVLRGVNGSALLFTRSCPTA